MSDSTNGQNEPRRVPGWGSGADETSELPTAASSQVRPAPAGPPPVQNGPAGAQRPYGRVGNEPVPGPYGATGPYGAPGPYGGAGERKYGAFLPALVAGALAAALTIVLGLSADKLAFGGNRWLSPLGVVSGYFDIWHLLRRADLDSGAQFAAAAVVGLATLLLTLLAALSAGRTAARGLLFFAVWGIVGIAASAAALVGGSVAGTLRFQPAELMSNAMYGAMWGVLFGWIPALGAAIARIGRRR